MQLYDCEVIFFLLHGVHPHFFTRFRRGVFSLAFVLAGEHMTHSAGWFIEDLGLELGGRYGCLAFRSWISFEGEKAALPDE